MFILVAFVWNLHAKKSVVYQSLVLPQNKGNVRLFPHRHFCEKSEPEIRLYCNRKFIDFLTLLTLLVAHLSLYINLDFFSNLWNSIFFWTLLGGMLEYGDLNSHFSQIANAFRMSKLWDKVIILRKKAFWYAFLQFWLYFLQFWILLHFYLIHSLIFFSP